MEEDALRRTLRTANAQAWAEEPQESKSLDSSLKKNTAFVKKLKTSITKEYSAQILKEINALSLTKYQSELLFGTQEGLLKCSKSSDVVAAIEIVSALHQRFSDSFTAVLQSWFLTNLENPKTPLAEKEEKERISKVKVLLRLFVEFVDVGIFTSDLKKIHDIPSYVLTRTKNGDSLIVSVLKEVLGYHFSNGNTLTIAITFVKRFPLLTESNTEVNHILRSFTNTVISKTDSMFSKLKDLSKKKFKAQIRVGKVVEDLEIEFNELSALFESFHTAAVALAEFFKIHLPEFRPEDLDYKPQDGDQVIISKETSIWINDEERRFYETIPEIPSDLIESNKDSKAEEMNEFLIKLETCLTIKDIDEVVLDFWTLKLNNKATRNRLIKHFTTSRDVGKAKIYARFLKSNEEYLGDIINEVIAYLDQGFRSQIYHNNVNFRNIVFFCELIKFKLIPEHVTFHKIRSLILSLTTPNNIEILSIFFEFCGKFLLREHERLMQEMLVLLESKRKNDKLTINNKMAISNLLLLLNPPSVKSLQERKKLRPEQAFLKILIRKELNLNNDSSIRKILNAVDYNDSDLFNTMVSLFTKPDKVNYENIVPLSNILKNLNSNFKILVVDTVLEQIIQGMEAADYRLNRIRMAQCKYIAEIYEHKIIGVSVLHDLIYKILTYGHPNNHPTWNKPSGLDRPDDYFRVQMVCIILDNVNFRKTSYQSKLTVLLKFFDYYIWLKEHPIPKNFEFQTIRVFEKYKFDRANDLKEAVERLSEVVQSRNASTGSISKEVSGNNNEVDEEDDDDDDDDDDEDEDEDDEDEDEDEDIGDVDGDIKPIKDQSIEGVTSDKDDEVVAKLSYEAYERKLQEEEERKLEERLEKEFKRVVAESVNSQRGAKASNMELPQTFQDLQENMDKDGNVATPKKIIPNAKGTIPFTLVTKKGKMIATKNLALPSNVRFASTIVEEGRKQREQKKLINKFILSSNFDD